MTTQPATQPAAQATPAVLVAEVRVVEVERPSPCFVRATFGGPDLANLSTADGFDTRFKVVFPGPTGRLPTRGETAEDWQEAWLGMPDDERSPMRTYTIREVRSTGDEVQLVTDFVVHEPGRSDVDDLGPACRWALSAAPGDVVHIVGPHRLAAIYGGTEFDPGPLRDLLVIGDETALPAIARILADVAPGFTGHVFVEVPSAADIVDLPRHDLVDVTWLVRGGQRQGRALVRAVRAHLGLSLAGLDAPLPEVSSELDVEVWETPRYSSAGEELSNPTPGATASPDLADTYAWIAGESWLVKAMRRALVTELGMERDRVAFMGYWREGVAMRS
jgi:NADPH-dependent ferric siderophore reductase